MKAPKLYFNLIVFAVVFGAAACSSETTNTQNNELTSMDSVSRELERANKDLDEQAKKVEASLEKLDQEITNSN